MSQVVVKCPKIVVTFVANCRDIFFVPVPFPPSPFGFRNDYWINSGEGGPSNSEDFFTEIKTLRLSSRAENREDQPSWVLSWDPFVGQTSLLPPLCVAPPPPFHFIGRMFHLELGVDFDHGFSSGFRKRVEYCFESTVSEKRTH